MFFNGPVPSLIPPGQSLSIQFFASTVDRDETVRVTALQAIERKHEAKDIDRKVEDLDRK